MKAALLKTIKESLHIDDVPVPRIGTDEVLVATQTCGVCRTDLHIQDGMAYIPNLPIIPGHEPAGIVAEIGEAVEGIEVGECVVPHLFLTCGCCRFCYSGRDSLCTDIGGVIGVTQDGGFAEYFKAPAKNLLSFPSSISPESAGLVSCAVITAVHAYRRARLSTNDTAVVVGAGGIGQILIQILKSAGVKVVAVSRSQASLDIATKLGSNLAIRLGSENATDQIKQLSGCDGAQCIFECVGTAETMKFASKYVMRGGQIIVIGEEPEYPQIDTIQIAQRELEIIGSRNGSRQDAVDSIKMMAEGIIDPPIVCRFPLVQINEAFDFVRSGQAHGRVIITIG